VKLSNKFRYVSNDFSDGEGQSCNTAALRDSFDAHMSCVLIPSFASKQS
jgi:hypothetical protein